MGQAVWLSDRGIVRVFGADAAALLQGVITNDVEKLSPHEARYAALLTPQGKILFDFFVVRLPARAGADFALDCNAGQAAEHYEITRYGSLIAWAKQLGRNDCASVLQKTLDEEKATDRKLTTLAESKINLRAAS